MYRRLTVGTVAGAIGLAVSVGVGAQAPSRAPDAPPSRTGASTPKTAWGDPDISGMWSTDDLRGIPVQRPDEFGNGPSSPTRNTPSGLPPTTTPERAS